MRKLFPLVSLMLLALLVWALILPTGAVHADGATQVDIPAETQTIRDLLDQAMRAYRLSDFTTAYKLARSAYLDHFENIELPLRARDADLTLDFEYRFATLRTKMQQGAPSAEVETAAQSVRDALDEVDSM